MFEQSILNGESAAHKTSALAASIGVQCLAVAIGILIPLILGDHMPSVQLWTKLSAPKSVAPEPVPVTSSSTASSAQSMLRARPRTLSLPSPNSRADGPPSQTVITDVVFTGTGDGFTVGVPSGFDGIPQTLHAVAPTPRTAVAVIPKPADKPVIVSSELQAGKLIRKIVPEYPPLAKQARVAGTVRLSAVINKDGGIAQLQVLSGHPLLVRSALAAVQQWLYRPTILNGVAVEVIAPIDVIFTLSQ